MEDNAEEPPARFERSRFLEEYVYTQRSRPQSAGSKPRGAAALGRAAAAAAAAAAAGRGGQAAGCDDGDGWDMGPGAWEEEDWIPEAWGDGPSTASRAQVLVCVKMSRFWQDVPLTLPNVQGAARRYNSADTSAGSGGPGRKTGSGRGRHKGQVPPRFKQKGSEFQPTADVRKPPVILEVGDESDYDSTQPPLPAYTQHPALLPAPTSSTRAAASGRGPEEEGWSQQQQQQQQLLQGRKPALPGPLAGLLTRAQSTSAADVSGSHRDGGRDGSLPCRGSARASGTLDRGSAAGLGGSTEQQWGGERRAGGAEERSPLASDDAASPAAAAAAAATAAAAAAVAATAAAAAAATLSQAVSKGVDQAGRGGAVVAAHQALKARLEEDMELLSRRRDMLRQQRAARGGPSARQQARQGQSRVPLLPSPQPLDAVAEAAAWSSALERVLNVPAGQPQQGGRPGAALASGRQAGGEQAVMRRRAPSHRDALLDGQLCGWDAPAQEGGLGLGPGLGLGLDGKTGQGLTHAYVQHPAPARLLAVAPARALPGASDREGEGKQQQQQQQQQQGLSGSRVKGSARTERSISDPAQPAPVPSTVVVPAGQQPQLAKQAQVAANIMYRLSHQNHPAAPAARAPGSEETQQNVSNPTAATVARRRSTDLGAQAQLLRPWSSESHSNSNSNSSPVKALNPNAASVLTRHSPGAVAGGGAGSKAEHRMDALDSMMVTRDKAAAAAAATALPATAAVNAALAGVSMAMQPGAWRARS